jgi:hypothetical protein
MDEIGSRKPETRIVGPAESFYEPDGSEWARGRVTFFIPLEDIEGQHAIEVDLLTRIRSDMTLGEYKATLLQTAKDVLRSLVKEDRAP